MTGQEVQERQAVTAKPKGRRWRGCTHKVKHGSRSLFITVNRNESGALSEIFIDTAREGTELRGLMNAMGMLASLALQHGCEPQRVAKILMDFEPRELPHQVGKVLAAEILEGARDEALERKLTNS